MIEKDESDHVGEILCEWCLVHKAEGKFYVPGKGIFYLCKDCKRLVLTFLIDGE